MIQRDVQIKLESGLEARPIAMLVQVASQFDSNVYIVAADKRVNAKSIMGMMAFALKSGMEVVVTVDGEDEAEAMAAMEKQLNHTC